MWMIVWAYNHAVKFLMFVTEFCSDKIVDDMISSCVSAVDLALLESESELSKWSFYRDVGRYTVYS